MPWSRGASIPCPPILVCLAPTALLDVTRNEVVLESEPYEVDTRAVLTRCRPPRGATHREVGTGARYGPPPGPHGHAIGPTRSDEIPEVAGRHAILSPGRLAKPVTEIMAPRAVSRRDCVQARRARCVHAAITGTRSLQVEISSSFLAVSRGPPRARQLLTRESRGRANDGLGSRYRLAERRRAGRSIRR